MLNVVMLSVTMLNVVMLSVSMLNVVMMSALVAPLLHMDKLKLKGRNLGQVFNSRRSCTYHALPSNKTLLRIEALDKITFRLSPVRNCGP